MFNFFPNKHVVAHMGQGADGRGLSPRLWTNILGSHMPANGLDHCIAIGDDFLSFGEIDVTSNVGIYASEAGLYGSYEGNDCSIAPRSDVEGGVIRLLTHTTDNTEAHIQSGGNVGTMFRINEDAPLTIFECRFAPIQIVACSLFVGLCATDRAVTDNMVDSTGEIANANFLGFHSLNASPARLDFVHRRAGGDVQRQTDLHTMVAGDYIKVGFLWDPRRDMWNRLQMFVNNVVVGSLNAAAVGADTFPNLRLAFNAGVKTTGGSAVKSIDIDWWAAYQAV